MQFLVFFYLKEKCCFDDLWILYLNRRSKLREHEYFSMYLYLRWWRHPWHLFLTLIPYCPHKNISIKIWKIHVESGNWLWNLQKTCVKIDAEIYKKKCLKMDTEIYRKSVWKFTLKFTENLCGNWHWIWQKTCWYITMKFITDWNIHLHSTVVALLL